MMMIYDEKVYPDKFKKVIKLSDFPTCGYKISTLNSGPENQI